MGKQVPIGTGMFKLCHDDTVKREDEEEESEKARRNVKGKASRGKNASRERWLKPAHQENLLFDSVV